MKKYNYNFSLITPGGCSASCGFCTDSFNEKFSKTYIKDLIAVMQDLPSTFDQVSVTGGEPTQSPLLNEIIMVLKIDKYSKQQFTKRVFTTNGWKLKDYIKEVGEVFNHVNISRHAIGDEANFEIFKTTKIATDAEITEYCSELSKYSVDVNLNHVYAEELSLEYIYDFIKYAKSLNATKVTFRYDQNTNQMQASSTEEKVAELYAVVDEGGCPVCREACYLINGMYVTFKNSCAEPSLELGGELYELIFHPDGKLYKDWSKKNTYKGAVKDKVIQILKANAASAQIEVNNPFESDSVTTKHKTIPIEQRPSYNRGSGGCGSGGCGR